MKSKVKYFYLHDSKKQRHVTVAYTSIPDRQLLLFAYAISHPKDRFNKSIGRNLATGRLLSETGKEEGWVTTLYDEEKPIEKILQVFSEKLLEESIPSCLVKMAKKRLENN